ncbi:IS200/IS605 family transposase [Bacteroidales bacterium OttesenSCG-928-B11]|nr:IS200/IS605 family transposase [Bacteroidales bacterium OttesenSCG-928-C03]MDL2312683.1 IS200/IS605 family transposase [Bacteroidales bacterium OttesenSCG-928-B11]
MGQSLAQVYLHLIFGTKKRQPFIDENIENDLFSYIGGIIKEQNGIPICINGISDHIHILCSFPRTIALSNFMKEIKGGSSRWIKTKGTQYRYFEWQNGYGAFSVSSSQKYKVEKYIMNQKKHHKKISFRSELIGFLIKYDIEYNETYLWDS